MCPLSLVLMSVWGGIRGDCDCHGDSIRLSILKPHLQGQGGLGLGLHLPKLIWLLDVNPLAPSKVWVLNECVAEEACPWVNGSQDGT